MNWEAIATIAEVTSAVAVVASLIYLALQIRQSNVESKASTYHQFLTTQFSANNAISESEEIAILIIRANEDFENLSAAELLRLQFIFYNLFNQWVFAFLTQKTSLPDIEIWDGIIAGYASLTETNPAFRKMWPICGSHFPEKFQAHVNTIIQRTGKQE